MGTAGKKGRAGITKNKSNRKMVTTEKIGSDRPRRERGERRRKVRSREL